MQKTESEERQALISSALVMKQTTMKPPEVTTGQKAKNISLFLNVR